MEAMEMKDLRVGQWGLFDAIYGSEKVLDITHYTLTDPTGDGPRYGGGVHVLHFRVANERDDQAPFGRFITRAAHEPVVAMDLQSVAEGAGVE